MQNVWLHFRATCHGVEALSDQTQEQNKYEKAPQKIYFTVQSSISQGSGPCEARPQDGHLDPDLQPAAIFWLTTDDEVNSANELR